MRRRDTQILIDGARLVNRTKAISVSPEGAKEMNENTVYNQLMSKQPERLEAEFTARVLETTRPVEHYYVVTHDDNTGKIEIQVDTIYNLEKVDWQKRDEVYLEWVETRPGTFKLMITCHVGTETNAKDKKKAFSDNVALVIKYVCMIDSMIFLKSSKLTESTVHMCYHDGYQCVEVVDLGKLNKYL